MSDFNLDAILQEFNVGNTAPVTAMPVDASVTRVRESLGLGRSLFRRKQSPTGGQQHEEPAAITTEDGDDGDQDMDMDFADHNVVEKLTKPRKRIVDSEDEDEDIPTIRTAHRSSSILSSPHKDSSDMDASNPADETPDSSLLDSDDDPLPTTEDILADFRRAKLEALSAKVAAKVAPKKSNSQDSDTDTNSMEMRESPMERDISLSPSVSGRKPKRRAAGKKALEEMNRETQRMARNMGLKPEVKVAKKIEMSSIFAKFGFNPDKVKVEESTPSEEMTVTPGGNEIVPEVNEMAPALMEMIVPVPVETTVPLPTRYATPDLDASSDEESLPSPSKLATFYIPKPAATKQSPPRKVHFTLPATLSDDSDSDVEILPPRSNLNTTTPDRQRTRRSALIRSLANIKSPGQKSPGRMTHKELEEVLSREAAVQASKKREERRAELRNLGIDVGKIVEKRDALEEAREEARRVREEEGGSESDEEYVDAEEVDVVESGDESGGSGDDEMDEGDDEDDDEDEDEEMADESNNEMDEEELPKKRKGVARITSDDEDEDPSQAIIPESTIGSEKTAIPRLSDFQAEDVSLTQFFDNTQLSGSTEKPTQHSKSPQSETTGTGLTQFFTSTALEDELPPSGEDTAHTRMDALRHKAAQGVSDLGPDSIGFQGVPAPVNTTSPDASAITEVAETEADESPVRRRILKRRNVEKSVLVEKPAEEINEATKDFVEEQAEESEDDYAQWRSGDEDEENMNGVVEGLIDDETKINTKRAEQDIARLYMEDQLEMDEKVVKGLMHDIQNGGLRRRRGQLEMGDWDSDDDDEDADERRRRWELKREEMKRRMLEDENLGKLAANPKTQAFLNAISSTTLNYDDEPDFLGEEIIEDTKAGTASRNLPNSIPMGESQSQSQSQSQDTSMSVEIQVPATNSGNMSRHERDRLVIDELTQIEDSQPLVLDDVSLSEASDSETEERESFVPDKVYTGFIDRAAQKRASRTISETQTRFAFKAVTSLSPARAKRTAVSVIEADDESTRKKIMKEVMGSKTVKRKAWGSTRGRGAVTFRASGGRNKENVAAEMKKGDADADRRRRDMLMLMDSQNSFC